MPPEGNERDPLDGLEQPSLAEQLEPYRDYGDDELAVSLLSFAKVYGGNGISTPAAVGFDIWCENCRENVRTISRPGKTCTCPLCENQAGLLALGRGPKEVR